MKKIQEVLRQIPAVDSILQGAGFVELLGAFGREPTRRAVQKVLKETREQIRAGQLAGEQLEGALVDEQLVRVVRALLEEAHQVSVGRAINATGVILHTGLGRAKLPAAAMKALAGLDGYCTLQMDMQGGGRSKRDGKVEELLIELTGAQAATVVNNNAAATRTKKFSCSWSL